jgi:GNAT superfamily N-acetyltransferase
MPEDILTVKVRPVRDGDWPLIYDTFVRSAGIGQAKLRPEVFKKGKTLGRFHKELAYRLDVLKSRDATFKVACDPDDNDLIMGWAAGEGPVLHYIYIKTAYRGQGIARELVAELGLANQSPLAYTVRTMTSEVIAETHPDQLIYIGFD